MGVIAKTCLVIAAIWILAVIFCWWLQQKVLFYPVTEMTGYRPPDAEVFHLDSNGQSVEPADDTITGWYIPGERVVLFCHGNAGNISHRDYIIDLCRLFNLGIIVFDYQGYGMSQGEPSVKAIYQDSSRVYHYAITKVDPSKLYIWGESLGGSAATYLASKHPCAGLILLATFSSLDDILIYSQSPYAPLSLGLRITVDTLRTKDRITQVKCPVAIVHSLDDQLIPFDCARCLYDRVTTRRLLIPIHGGHASPSVTVNQILTLMDFFDIKPVAGYDQLQEALSNINTAAERHHLI